jgi:uncharacterized membrane protein
MLYVDILTSFNFSINIILKIIKFRRVEQKKNLFFHVSYANKNNNIYHKY